MACANCGSIQGPFSRTVLPLAAITVRLPAKSQLVFAVCGLKRGSTKEDQLTRTRECNTRRAKADEGKG